jgi:hypothetical protein
MTTDPEDRLVFLISAPRSGSTLLARILNATDAVSSRPEPHLLTPLAHAGAWQRVQQAPYDPVVSQRAIRSLLADLPAGQAVHRAACRAYADTHYAALLDNGGKALFLDKTPAYALVLPFLTRLYPRARYIVLTRHPAAIFSSYSASFFDNDDHEAVRFNPVLARYVPAIGRFLRDPPARLHHVRFEALVCAPAPTLSALSLFLGIADQPDALQYHRVPMSGHGPGDPTGVHRHDRPEPSRASAWVQALAATPGRRALIEQQLRTVSDQDLAAWGYPRGQLWDSIEAGRQTALPRALLRRRLLLALRRVVRVPLIRSRIETLRDACEVLLRG